MLLPVKWVGQSYVQGIQSRRLGSIVVLAGIGTAVVVLVSCRVEKGSSRLSETVIHVVSPDIRKKVFGFLLKNMLVIQEHVI